MSCCPQGNSVGIHYIQYLMVVVHVCLFINLCLRSLNFCMCHLELTSKIFYLIFLEEYIKKYILGWEIK